MYMMYRNRVMYTKFLNSVLTKEEGEERETFDKDSKGRSLEGRETTLTRISEGRLSEVSFQEVFADLFKHSNNLSCPPHPPFPPPPPSLVCVVVGRKGVPPSYMYTV